MLQMGATRHIHWTISPSATHGPYHKARPAAEAHAPSRMNFHMRQHVTDGAFRPGDTMAISQGTLP